MVEWKKLGEVVELARGVRVVKTDLATEGMIPVFQNSLSPLGYYDIHNYPAGTTFVISAGAAGDIGFSDMPFWAADDCLGVTCPNDTLNKFVFYFLQTKQSILKSQVRKASVPRLSRTVVEKLDFPCIPISEQSRIVGILDTFTASIANLKEQIGERRKQYEHYRDQLLDLEGKEGVEMKTLGEVGEFIRGAGILKSDFVDEGMPCIHYGQIHTKYGFSTSTTFSRISESLYKKSRKAIYGDVVLATTSEDAEGVARPVVWLGEDSVAISGDSYVYHHSQNGKYMAHLFLSHRFFLFKIRNATGAKVVRISGDSMAKFEFPLPSLSEQSRIVSILDQFEASIANLEAQLQEREKQYEHYRNQLLTFE